MCRDVPRVRNLVLGWAVAKGVGSGTQEPWLQILALPLSSSVALGGDTDMYHLPWGFYVTDSGSLSAGEVLLLSPFPDWKTEAQRGYRSCPKTHVYSSFLAQLFVC